MVSSAEKQAELTPVQRAHKRIKSRKQNKTVAGEIAKQYSVSEITGRVLAARGHTCGSDLEQYLNPTLKTGLPDPAELLNLDAGVEVVREVVAESQSIAVCCDFDVDGTTGGSIVKNFLTDIGVECEVFVPDRFKDGYGLNEGMVREIAERGFSLLITVDYGTTNVVELNLARELGLKTIVVDHHHVAENPPSDVFINPNQKGCGFAGQILCAAGLAWYFVIGLKKVLPAAKDIDIRRYLDLACLGTICDLVPLVGVNRVIAKRGLELLGTTQRVGLRALKNVMGVHGEVSGYHVGFGIGPRINAAGRMLSASLVIELLTTRDEKRASTIATKLNKLNVERQEEEERIKRKAIQQVRERDFLPNGLVAHSAEFHTGVIGIVAQRLVEEFYRPSIVIGSDDGKFKGSVRGIKGFNVVEALEAVGEHLLKFGGHSGAGGFSIAEDKIPDFIAAFEAECTKRLEDLSKEPYVEADAEVELSELDFNIIDELKSFQPYGIGNPGPVLLAKKLTVRDIKVLKSAHLKVTLSDGSQSIPALMWNVKSHPALVKNEKVNVAFKAQVNSFRGMDEIQLVAEAIEAA